MIYIYIYISCCSPCMRPPVSSTFAKEGTPGNYDSFVDIYICTPPRRWEPAPLPACDRGGGLVPEPKQRASSRGD